MDEEQRVNFRQVGTRASGHVLRGAAVRQRTSPDPQSRVTSIPSKYETVLHRDQIEKDAFGYRTQRFADSENDLPGPGAYYKPPSMVKTTAESGSVSKLGYSTGFVSKTKRFNDRIREVLPGPGQYQDARLENKPQINKSGTSCFASSGRSNNQHFTTTSAVPGPGNYNIEQTSSAIAHNIARAAFSSKTTRGFAPKTDVPAPGQYDSIMQNRSGGQTSSVFKSSVKRLNDPITDITPTPGPGAYNTEIAEFSLRYDKIAQAHISAVFHKGNVDRFGRQPTKRATDSELGPGAYDVSLLQSDRQKPTPSSIFKSSTTRCDDSIKSSNILKSDAPGPAFYHPTALEKRSHLLNSNKKWI